MAPMIIQNGHFYVLKMDIPILLHPNSLEFQTVITILDMSIYAGLLKIPEIIVLQILKYIIIFHY